VGPADGPTVGRGHARYGTEGVILRSAGVRGTDDGPRAPVPVLDQRLCDAVVVVTNGPAVRGRRAGHAPELVVLRNAGVGRGDDGPRAPVPVLDHGLCGAIAVVVVADGPAVGRGCARHAMEVIVLRSAGVGRADECPQD